MSYVLQFLGWNSKPSPQHDWHLPVIRQYFLTGDESLLDGLTIRDTWTSQLQCLNDPFDWNEDKQRLLHLAVRFNLKSIFEDWISRPFRAHQGDWERFDASMKLLREAGATEDQCLLAVCDVDQWLEESDQPSPAGRLMLNATDSQLAAAFQNCKYPGQEHMGYLMARERPEQLVRLLEGGMSFDPLSAAGTYLVLLQANADLFHALTYEACKEYPYVDWRVIVAARLAELKPDLYHAWALQCIWDCLPLAKQSRDTATAIFGLFQVRHPGATGRMKEWFLGELQEPYPSDDLTARKNLLERLQRERRLETLADAGEICSESPIGELAAEGIKQWRVQGIPAEQADRYHASLRRVLIHKDGAAAAAAVKESATWNLERMQEDLWPILAHKSRPARVAATRTLETLGDAALDKAAVWLKHKKAEGRLSAVALLEQVGTAPALALLKARLETEDNDTVRDAILLVLEHKGGGVSLDAIELAARMSRTLEKAKGSPLPWLEPGNITLKKKDGGVLSSPEVLYLLLRQSRCDEMRADLEAKALYAQLDRVANDDTAVHLLQQYQQHTTGAEHRWVLALAALLGHERLATALYRAILDWADNRSRGRLPEHAAQALALIGTDAALMLVDSLSVRFRSKNKNLGKAAADAFAAAAERRGVSVDELGDLVVPWLGFEPGVPRVLPAGKTTLEVRIGKDFKFVFRDQGTGKLIAKLPAAVGADLAAEFKTLTATLREAVKAQLLRMETLLVRQYRWPAARWRELYQGHPLLRPFTERLVWGWRDEGGRLRHTFRALDDGTLTDAADDCVLLPEGGTITLIHPLDLHEPSRAAWVRHLVDYKVEPPFSQLDRTVVRVKDEERGLRFGKHLDGVEMNAMTFRSRAEKLGWTRGSVGDGGNITCYRKVFSGAGVEVFLLLDMLFVSSDMNDSIGLMDFFFVRGGSVRVGSDVYDEPVDEKDPRLIAFGDVPPVPFSETIGDLMRIRGQADANTDDEAVPCRSAATPMTSRARRMTPAHPLLRNPRRSAGISGRNLDEGDGPGGGEGDGDAQA